MKPKILFLGNNTAYSDQVKTALTHAGYNLIFLCSDRSIKILDADLIITAAYGEKITNEQLGAAKYGGLNLHPSLLPAYRGATPVPHQILDGITQSGITIIKMTGDWDAGPIVAQKTVPVLPGDTSLDLLHRSFAAGAELLIKVLPGYLNNKITLKAQPKDSPTPYCRRFIKEDGLVTWEEFKQGVNDKKIRAFFPWPGVWTKMPNGKVLKLLPKNMFQIEGKQPINRQQFLAGYRHLLQ